MHPRSGRVRLQPNRLRTWKCHTQSRLGGSLAASPSRFVCRTAVRPPTSPKSTKVPRLRVCTQTCRETTLEKGDRRLQKWSFLNARNPPQTFLELYLSYFVCFDALLQLTCSRKSRTKAGSSEVLGGRVKSLLSSSQGEFGVV